MSKFKFSRDFIHRTGAYVVAIGVVTFMILLVYNYYISKKIIIENIKDSTRSLAVSTLFQINTVLVSAEKMPEDLATILDCADFSEEELKKILEMLVENNPCVYGSVIAFEPYMFDKNKKLFCPYYFKPDGKIMYDELGKPSYNYLNWDWYQKPKQLRKGIWSEPYFDKEGGNIKMVTYSCPFYKTVNGEKVFRGVVTCDIALNWLEDLISKIKIFKTGYAFILSPKGVFIAHPNKEYYTRGESFFTLSDRYNDKVEREIGEKMLRGESGFMRYYSHNKKETCYTYFEPLAKTGCTLGIVIPENELLVKLRTLTITLFLIGAIGNVLSLIFKISKKTLLFPLKAVWKAITKKRQ